VNRQQQMFTVRFRRPDGRCPRTRHVWGTKAKPSGVGAPTALLFEQQRNAILKRSAARLAEKAPNVMLYLELPEGLQGSKIPFKRFKANIF
jgi:hypothetical protein